MVAAASSLSQETLNKLYQTKAYKKASVLYGSTSEDDDIVDFAIHELSQALEYNPLLLTNEVEALIALGLVQDMQDFNNKVQAYFDEEEKIQQEEIAEIFS